MRTATAEDGMITQHQLTGYLGKTIAQICPNGYARDAEHHGAHFVAHVLGYQFGVTCQMLGTPKGAGASLQIQDLFQQCPKIGVWSLRPASLASCLVFITRASTVNLAARSMANVPRKQVGIFVDGVVWHYSDTQHRVIRQTSAQFSLHYPAPDNAMFYGSLP